MSVQKNVLIIGLVIISILILGCSSTSRLDLVPARETMLDGISKIQPEKDVFSPVLHSREWTTPVPMEGPINTAGAEDSPFITPDGNAFFFFFTPDVNVPPEEQLKDRVTGLWWSRKENGMWTEPEKIILHDDVSLEGAAFVQDDTMWFGSIRAGNYGEADFYTARYKDARWKDVKNAGKQLNADYDVGELHITPDGRAMYFGRGSGDRDIWMSERTNNGWSEPVRVLNINSNLNEDQPFITPDGEEMWFTGDSRLGFTGPAVFRSVKNQDGNWGKPEEIISNFAGEPTLDSSGNIYFVHHFFSKDLKMIEADIYVSNRK